MAYWTIWSAVFLLGASACPRLEADDCEASAQGPLRTFPVMTRSGLTNLPCVAMRDLVIAEGDILMPRLSSHNRGTLNPFGVGRSEMERLWPNKIVPYTLAESLQDDRRITWAMEEWGKAGVKFVRRTHQVDWVEFIRDSKCHASFVGKQGGRQKVLVKDDGCSRGNVAHEIGHVLGLWHEQSRHDRDEHVQIVWTNIPPENTGNFTKVLNDAIDTEAYDLGSIMHYGPRAGAINPNYPTIIPKKPTAVPVGQREGLSPGDIAAIRILYHEQ